MIDESKILDNCEPDSTMHILMGAACKVLP
jgi:hypothetical protein